jgi:tetratricopeptide (TPR) repeat protein
MNHRKTALTIALLFSTPPALRAQEPTLETLRTDLADHYVEARPHMALAHYFHDKGDRLQAFRLLESARRSLISQEQFDEAFGRSFLKREPFDNSKDAEALLLAKLAQDSKSAQLAVKLADIFISREEWPKAREYLGLAINLEPEDFKHVGVLAEVFTREGKADESARIIQNYVDKYPQSKEALSRRIDPLMTKDPAAARKLLTEGMEKFPQESSFVFNMAVVLQNEQKLKEAEEHFVRAAALAKDSPHIHGWTGRFYLKVKNDEAMALKYYLNAYFLDPHFYDSEYAERRIWSISQGLARKKFEGLVKAGKKPEEIVLDENPLVVGMAVDEIGKRWDAKFTKPLLAALGHDDGYVRAKALRALVTNVGRSFDNDLKTLLKDSDLRKRGLAGYLAVKLWGDEGITEITPWLNADAQLLRYDAVSALVQYGGEPGRKIVRAHVGREKNPLLKKWLEAAIKDK